MKIHLQFCFTLDSVAYTDVFDCCAVPLPGDRIALPDPRYLEQMPREGIHPSVELVVANDARGWSFGRMMDDQMPSMVRINLLPLKTAHERMLDLRFPLPARASHNAGNGTYCSPD